jgi:hypothetical protein
MLSLLQDRNTRYVDIGPVNKAINMLACWMDNPTSEEFERWGLGAELTRNVQLLFTPVVTH